MPRPRKTPPVTLYVVQIEDTWRVRHSAVIYGPYATPQTAMAKAINFAHRLGAPSRDVKVLLESADHEFNIAWPSGPSGENAVSSEAHRGPSLKSPDAR